MASTAVNYSYHSMRLLLLISALTFVVPAFAADPPHWSLRPRTRPAVPDVPRPKFIIRSPVDAFILAKLQKEGLSPAPEADRATLIRRVTFDLIGLPPTPAEIEAFVKDTDPNAYERVVDRLLASAHYGEKWGRHWLDLVRYSETEGFEYDRYRSGAWRYRDYIITSFNDDKPFDRFVMEQLAGDELAETLETAKADERSRGQNKPDGDTLRIAAGFHRLGPVRPMPGTRNLRLAELKC